MLDSMLFWVNLIALLFFRQFFVVTIEKRHPFLDNSGYHTHQTRKDVFLIMIPQIPTEMKTSFKELKFAHFLLQANITKAKGFSALFIFITIFMLTFQKETWFEQTTMSKKAASLPGKDAIYRFLNKSTFN